MGTPQFHKAKWLPWPRTADDGTPLGLDLAKLHKDIRHIVFAKVQPPDGWTYSDFLQEVFVTLVSRNHQPSAYDPRRGSWPNYVVRAAQSARYRLWKGTQADKRQMDPDYFSEPEEEPADEEEPFDLTRRQVDLPVPVKSWHRTYR